MNLAWAQMKLGKYKEAFESVTRALRLDPKNAFAYAIRAFVKEKLGDNQGKMDDIKRATALDSRFLSFAMIGGVGYYYYETKKKGSVRNFQEFLDSFKQQR